MSLSLRRRVVKWSFGTILVLSASVVSAQRPLNMNDYDLRNQYGTMPGLNDRNPNQIQYGNIGGVVDNNAPQEADTTQKPPKIRKPLESYFFDDSTRSRQSFAWRVNLERNDVAIIEVDTALNGFQNDYPFLQNNVGSAMLGNMGGASVPLDFFLRPQYSDFTFAQAFDAYLMTPERARFFNVKKPFTHLSYFMSGLRSIWKRACGSRMPRTFRPRRVSIWTTRAGERAASTNGRARGRKIFRSPFRIRARNTAFMRVTSITWET